VTGSTQFELLPLISKNNVERGSRNGSKKVMMAIDLRFLPSFLRCDVIHKTIKMTQSLNNYIFRKA
jgi:hypothetical protein